MAWLAFALKNLRHGGVLIGAWRAENEFLLYPQYAMVAFVLSALSASIREINDSVFSSLLNEMKCLRDTTSTRFFILLERSIGDNLPAHFSVMLIGKKTKVRSGCSYRIGSDEGNGRGEWEK